MPIGHMKIEKVGHRALMHAVNDVAGGTAGDQTESRGLKSPVGSHCPNEKSDRDRHFDPGQHQRTLKKKILEHAEADASVEAERQVEKGHNLDSARRDHHGIENQPLCSDVEQKRGGKSTTNPYRVISTRASGQDNSSFIGVQVGISLPTAAAQTERDHC